MKTVHRIFLVVLCLLLAATGVGLFLTRDRGEKSPRGTKGAKGPAQSLVDMSQMQTAMALAELAATQDEQDLARDAMRAAYHEVDFEFASALYQAAAQPVPSTPEIRAILERISNAEKNVADIDAEIARINKLLSTALGAQKQALDQQMELAKARQELNQDELADADEDLERSGGDPHGAVQRMVEEHEAAAQDRNGQLDLSIVGKQAGATLPDSGSFLSRVRALVPLRGLLKQLTQAEGESKTKIATFSSRHDELERQLQEQQAEQRKKLAPSAGANPSKGKPTAAGETVSAGTGEAISSYRSMMALQKRVSALDGRIRNQGDLVTAYQSWSALAATREKSLLHSLLISVTWMLLIALCVLIADFSLAQIFSRLAPDQKNLLTLRAVIHVATRGLGAILILLVIFGPPTQIATILALAGAGLTVALKDFIVGFFGWFVLMGKNGIRNGDWVEINGVSGEVVQIGLLNTVLLETGNWNDAGHPTGRRVTFVNSYAIEGHYFNFSTSGQWLWDELDIVLPADQDPYPVADEIRKIVIKETEANSRLAEREWERLGSAGGVRPFSADPAVSVRPANVGGFEILSRYVTRANERQQQRSKLYLEVVALLRRKNIPQEKVSAPPDTPSVATA